MSDDPVAFLRARLDEDEGVARLAACDGGTWKQEDPERFPGWISSSIGGRVSFDEGAPDENQAPHIARHDPARVLREVAAHRSIVTSYELAAKRYESGVTMRDLAEDRHQAGTVFGLKDAVMQIATVYSDHPDYRKEWNGN